MFSCFPEMHWVDSQVFVFGEKIATAEDGLPEVRALALSLKNRVYFHIPGHMFKSRTWTMVFRVQCN